MAAKTLTEYANSIDRDFFNLRKASKIAVHEGFEYLSYIVLENYLDILLENAEYVTLSDQEVKRFSYKPKALSKFLYDTENLYYLLLLLNNMTVETFVPKKIYVLSASNRTLIEDIINLEKKLKNI